MTPATAESHRYLRIGQKPAQGGEALVFAQCRPTGDVHRGYGEGASAMAALHGPVEEGSQWAVREVLSVSE
jgi:hypothetical protein